MALNEVSTFVADNRGVLKQDVADLTSVTGTIAADRNQLAELLDNAPVALSNLQNAYNPPSGTLDVRDNADQLNHPDELLCGLINQQVSKVTACQKWRCAPAAVRAADRAVRTRRLAGILGSAAMRPAGPDRRSAAPRARDDRLRRLSWPPSPRCCCCPAAARARTTSRCPAGSPSHGDIYRVTVQFADVLDLVPQSAVKVGDVTVGSVEKITLDGWTARVTVRLKDSVSLPDNATAELKQTSLLGEKYVSLAEADRRRAGRPPLRRRRHPAVALGSQPRGRGGPRRDVVAAQRRRRRPAEDHRDRAQQGA